MKRFCILSLLYLMIYMPASAHAGMYDRHLQVTESIDTLCCVVAVIHLLCFLIIHRVHCSKFLRLKKCIVGVGSVISRKEWVACIAGWLLSTLAWSIYLCCFLNIFWIFAFLPFWVIWIFLSVNIFVAKKRRKLFTGGRAIAKLIFTSMYQVFGIIVYSLICELPVMHRYIYYTDTEYDGYEFKIYPGIEGVLYVLEWMAEFAGMLAVPFFLLMLYKLSKKVTGKCLR